MYILSIETSCDETAAAIVKWDGEQVTVLANTISSQASLHNEWGGVVPSLASREHIKNIIPVIEEALTRAALKPKNIDLIAVTQGPGLMPALLIGVSAGKTLSLVWQKPLIGINHLEGHIYANLLGSQNEKFQISNFKFPLLALIVSGGHTQLVLMRKHFDYTILGETQDDAAGEAFDKVAKLLGLPYPGGPEVAKRADEYRIRNQKSGMKELTKTKMPSSVISAKAGIQNPQNHLKPQCNINIKFPRPMLNSDNFNFSFSGLKTAVLYFLKKNEAKIKNEKFVDEVCYEFQEAIVDVLVCKTKKAIELYSPKTLVIAGGVSANVRLRARLQETVANLKLEVELPSNNQLTFLTPEFSYSLDNAAMIAGAAAFRYELMDEKQKQSLYKTCLTLDPDANLPLTSI
jgi:N6-L-threonylcarbamoyladenine synthase